MGIESRKYSIRAERSSSNFQLFNISNIQRLDEPICLDVGLFVAQSINTHARSNNVVFNDFINDVIKELTKMFLWHNIKIKVQTNILTTDSFPESNSNGDDLIQLMELMKTAYGRKDVNMYLRLKTNPNRDQYGGYAYLDTVCKEDAVGSLNIYSLGGDHYNVQMVASLLAHEIGHQLGFRHSDRSSSQCKCGFDHMYCLGSGVQYDVNSNIPKSFESCLITKLKNSLSNKSCLSDCNFDPSVTFCGDGSVGSNERCDCGFNELCKLTGQDRCCDHNTCQFKNQRFQCDSGYCCDNCMFSSPKSCDSTQFINSAATVCTGTSENCEIRTVNQNQHNTDSNTNIKQNKLKKRYDNLCKRNFDNNNFYSERCYENIKAFMDYHCRDKTSDNYFVKSYCKDELSICELFVCEGKEIAADDIKDSINYGDYYCNYYNPNKKPTNIFGSHNGINCGDNKKCMRGNCVNNIARAP